MESLDMLEEDELVSPAPVHVASMVAQTSVVPAAPQMLLDDEDEILVPQTVTAVSQTTITNSQNSSLMDEDTMVTPEPVPVLFTTTKPKESSTLALAHDSLLPSVEIPSSPSPSPSAPSPSHSPKYLDLLAPSLPPDHPTFSRRPSAADKLRRSFSTLESPFVSSIEKTKTEKENNVSNMPVYSASTHNISATVNPVTPEKNKEKEEEPTGRPRNRSLTKHMSSNNLPIIIGAATMKINSPPRVVIDVPSPPSSPKTSRRDFNTGTAPKSKIQTFLGKMSLSKERMGKLVEQSKGAPPKGPQPTAVKFEGIFGIPLKTIMQYASEQGHLLPSALHKIFSKLDSLNVLMTPRIYMREPNVNEINRVRKAFDDGEAEVSLRDVAAYDVCALLVLYFSLLPEPIIPVECYEVLLRYHTNEKLLRMTMEKLPSPNKYILYRLLCHMYDVHTCSAFNNINLSHVVRIFEQTKFQFILRSTSTFHADEDQTTEEAKTIQQVIEMLVHRRDELLKPAPEESTSEETVHLSVDFVGALTYAGGVRLTDTSLYWRPNVQMSPRQHSSFLIQFGNISKVELFGAAKKELLKALPSTHFVIYYSSSYPPSPRSFVTAREQQLPADQVKTLTLGFEDLPTCKLVYTYILGMIKNQASRSAVHTPPFRYDMYGMGLMSLPSSLCRQMVTTQEINLGRNSFNAFPYDVMWAESLKTLTIEENQIAAILPDVVQFMGKRMHNLEMIGLSGNMLTTVPPLSPLKHLRSINLSSNRITSLPADILSLPCLETIIATHNQLTDLPQNVIPSAPLKTLDLRSNRFNAIPSVVANMKSLTLANFSHNNISTIPIAMFKWTSLLELKLDNNSLITIPPEIKYMSNLRKLDSNQIIRLPIGIGEMRSLMELRLSHNKLTTLPMTLLSLNKLVTLEVDGNNLEGVPVDVIKKGREAILDVLKSKMTSLVPCTRYRIVMFGERRSGKSSLISQISKHTSTVVSTSIASASSSTSSLSSSSSSITSSPSSSSIVGLVVHEWTAALKVTTQEGRKVKEGTFHTWEFTEKDLVHDIHPIFLTDNCVPVIVWNLAVGDERYVAHCLDGVNKIAKSRRHVVVVGTHSDDPSLVKKQIYETLDKMHKKYKELFPKLEVHYYAVNCLKADSENAKKVRKQIESIASSYLQSVPSSFFLFEEYMREMVTVSNIQFLPVKKLRRIAKMFGLKQDFSHVRKLFKDLGSLFFFSSEDLTDEIAVLKPEVFVNSLFTLIKNTKAVSTPLSSSVPPSPVFAPPSPSLAFTPSSPPSLSRSPSGEQDGSVSSITGIFPHYKLKEVWGMDSSYFSDVLSLLERNGVLFNFYNTSLVEARFPMLGRAASHVTYVPSTGYALIPSHLPPAPRSSDLGSLWHPLPEASLTQYGRRYLFELVPRGLFGIMLARTAQFARLVRCWENSAIFVASNTVESNLLALERVWIRFVPHSRRLDIMSRVPPNTAPHLAHLIIRMAEEFLVDRSAVSVPCSHCSRFPDPYTFSLPVLWAGDSTVLCQKNGISPPLHSETSPPSSPNPNTGNVHMPVTNVLVEMAVLQSSNNIIPYSDLELDTVPLGGCKRVYIGSYRNETIVYKLYQPRQSNTVDRKVAMEFCNEVMNLAQIDHPGVIHMRGICFNPLGIVMEYIPFAGSGGLSLQQYLLDKKQDTTWSNRLEIAIAIAETMDYFASFSPQFCHVNLQSSNILLGKRDDKYIVKLTHLGQSGITPIVFAESMKQPAVWCAPEILQLGQINDKSAVYSFGVVLWELAARAEFLPEVKTKDTLLELMNKGLMPNVPSGCPDEFGELIISCLNRDANKRPSFKETVATLNKLKLNIMDWSLQQFRGQALMATPPLAWGTELVSLDPTMTAIHKLSIGSITQEDSLETVMSDIRGATYQGLLQHMKSEFAEEIFEFFQQVALFKGLNMLAPEEQALAKASAKQIWEVYITDGSPKEINLASTIRENLRGHIFGSSMIASEVFAAAEDHVRPLLEDSFRRYKKTIKGYGSVTWEKQICSGQVPPAGMVGHTAVIHRDKVVVVGGWAGNRWSCDTIYKLHKKNFKWCKHMCTGDIPPPSSGAATATLVGNTILYCCLPNYVYQLFLDTNRWVALKCNIVPATAGFADNLRSNSSPNIPTIEINTSFSPPTSPTTTTTTTTTTSPPTGLVSSSSKKLVPSFGFLSPRKKT